MFKANGKIELGLGKIKGRRGRQFCRSFDFSWSVTNKDRMPKKINMTKTTGLSGIIPDICHEPTSEARVNFFWPV